MSDTRISLLFGGDFSIGRDGARFMEGVDDLLDAADVRMLQLEEPYTRELLESAGPDKLCSCLDPIVGKLDLVTLAGNHFYDYGEQGVRDTIDWLHEQDIACCGGGSDIAEAAQPAFIEKDGVRIGVLAWNCIGSKYTFADEKRGGVNGLEFTRAYIPEDQLDQHQMRGIEWDIWALRKPMDIENPVMGFNFVNEQALMDMASTVRETREQCDILIVYFHKGYVHQPVVVAPWERFVSHIAIDNGADAVMSSHSHIAHGIEFYRGAPIFHGLNNFVMWTPQLSPNFKGKIPGGKDSNNEEWIKARVERFGFVPDPEYPTYPFHPESIYCPVAKLIIEGIGGDAHIAQTRMVLMVTEKSGIPYVHGQDERGQACFDYMQDITDRAGLNAELSWDGDEVVLTARAE